MQTDFMQIVKYGGGSVMFEAGFPQNLVKISGIINSIK